MKSLIICLLLALSACAIPSQNEPLIEERATEPVLFDAPVLAAPIMVPECPNSGIIDGDGIGGTGCP